MMFMAARQRHSVEPSPSSESQMTYSRFMALFPDNDACLEYLKARFFYHRFSESSLRKSLDFYQRVLLLEPGYARAYAGMADCWCRLADDYDRFDRTRRTAHRRYVDCR